MLKNIIDYLLGRCRRCETRNRLLERAAGNRQEISPQLWHQLREK